MRWLAMGLCLATCAGCLYANFSGDRAFGPWIAAVTATFCLYLVIRMHTA